MQREKRNGARIRVVVFDAVGTLLHPQPQAAIVYAEVGRRFGSKLDAATVSQLFRAAFARQEQLDRASNWRTSEVRELERWRTIVGEVLHDVADKENCFAALYEHFSQPSHWRGDAGAGALLTTLEQRGLQVALASNFDRRLRQVVAGFEPLSTLRHIVISSEIGWRKPAAEFFAAVSQAVDAEPRELLHVGDDLVNDYEGAAAAGFQSVLLAPNGKIPCGVTSVRNLANVVDLLSMWDIR